MNEHPWLNFFFLGWLGSSICYWVGYYMGRRRERQLQQEREQRERVKQLWQT